EKAMKKNEKAFAVGSGNIFEDLGFSEEESAALTLKSSLFNTLQMALRELTGTQAEVAAKLGIPQPKVSDILNGKQSGFSVERLASYLL
ncbi:helix-turn-helix domain-containing protein, partial [Staphylococcus aureus]